MARFTEDWLSALYSKSDIVDVVSGYTTLSERGGRHWGLCPFHNEKTPSFSVSRDKQLYYCFGCKQGGNVANFIMKIENVSFPEAVEILARRAGMEMPEVVDDRAYRQLKIKKQKIIEMNRTAAKFYHDTLYSGKGKAALDYLKKRGIDDRAIKRFGLGYAPDSWDAVSNLLKDKGFSQSVIKESGLVSVKNNKVFDTFRNRVVFPIISPIGDVIAFGGRVLDDSLPKYLNTRETAVFNKRKNLYGIDIIRRLTEIKSAVIVEGYMDVVSLCAHGVKAVVASLGTALTKEQAILLKRYTSSVYIAYDGDEAGEAATLKAIGILLSQGFKVRIVRFDKDEDPDEFIRANGLAAFARKVKNAPDSITYRIDLKKREFDINTDDGMEQYAIASSKIIEGIESPIIRERYVQKLAKETGYSEESIKSQIQKKDMHKNTNDNNRYNRIKNEEDNAESAFLAFLLGNPWLTTDVIDDIKADDMALKSHKIIFSALYDSVKRGIQPSYAEILSELDSEEDRSEAVRLSDIQVVVDEPKAYLKDCVSRVKAQAIARRRQQLVESLLNAGADERSKLLAEIGELDKELKQR